MPTPNPDQAQATPRQPPGPLGEVLAVMLKLGTIAFGGPAVHVAMLREEPSGAGTGWRMRSSWTRSARVSVLPGPSSTQLAIVLGRRRAGWPELLLGGAYYILPAGHRLRPGSQGQPVLMLEVIEHVLNGNVGASTGQNC